MSVSSGNGNDETMEAIKGGATFDERLNQLATAKQSLEAAYNDLGLGKSAKAAFLEATTLKQDAESKYETATKASEDIVTKARENAETISKRVRLQAEVERKAINDERDALQAKYDGLLADLEKKKVEADFVMKEALAARREAGNLYDEADELKLGLLNSKIAYDEELAVLRVLHGRVTVMMSALHYVEVSPDKMPPVVVPVVPVVPEPEPEPDLGGSMGGVTEAEELGGSMGGVE